MARRATAGLLAAAVVTTVGAPLAYAADRQTPTKATSGTADGRQPKGLRTAVDRLVADGQPGVIVMTRRGNKVAHLGAGVANQETGTPMDPRSQIRIASISKTFTATVLLQLVAEHRLSLDDTVDHWLPGVVRAGGNDGRHITVRNLLQHTSGLNEYALDPRIQTQPERVWKPQELVDIALEKKPLFEPGKGWSYANTNYILAGMIIEKVTGHRVESEIGRRIIRPLGLKHTSMPQGTGFSGPYVHGYYGSYGDVSTLISPSSGWTSGGMISTVDDVAKFHRALFTGRLLPRAQQRELTTTRAVIDDGTPENYGLGVYRVRLRCGSAWGHDGGWPGYRTWAYTSKDGKRQAIISYNQTDEKLQADPNFRADLKKVTEAAFCG
ncbi:serine hydrolase domain-containing protein [Actinoallomurus sp. NPDC052308]|uniref:serine hydrolase domain-containing protein n=1 Tax=Actinoallomurus sp. NPDC052308 TaxID=3155530 RepID=UPI003420292A